jgi:Type II secretory pathway, component PulK
MRRMGRRRARKGFVLLAVLWVLVGLAGLGLALSLVGRDAIGAAQNRVSLARAHWLAEGCVNTARAVIADELADRDHGDGGATWRAVDDVVTMSPVVRAMDCDLSVRAAGTTLDVNTADAEQLRRALLALGVMPLSADSIVDAILDWRDPDDEPRGNGAERAWYLAQHRFAPRNGPVADGRELARIRGLEALAGIDSVLGVEGGRVPLGRAPHAVLVALPGFTDELAQRIAELRDRDALPADLLTLAGALSPSARDSLAARYAEVVSLVTIDPDAWILTARARDGASPAVATVEVKLARAGTRAAVLRHRSWP